MRRLLFYMVGCMGITIFLASPVCAKVSGPCANCHTMHNSQNGTGMEIDNEKGPGPFPYLTRGSCIGCHTGTNVGGGTREGVTPFVMSDVALSEETYLSATLAGGNFWWVADDGGNNDTKGHNVLGLSGQDSNIPAATGAPGRAIGCSNSCHMTLAEEQTSISYLGSGCEGCHLYVKHHAGGTDYIADEDDGWFRFCSGHALHAGTRGATGVEDNDWQFTNDLSDHNEYLGSEANLGSAVGFYGLGNVMTGYCCGCHGLFHIEEDGGGAWIRHPSDAVIPNSGEYASYTVYDPIAPVARPDLTAYAVANPGDPDVNPGVDMVMCLSCHRAHGSPYADLLRWNYSQMVAGGGENPNGCFVCHTTKDDAP